MTFLAAIGLGLTACTTIAPASIDAVDPADRAAIEARVLDYFDGQGFADAERLDRAFSDSATMYGVVIADDGTESIRHWPDFQDILKGWGTNGTPAGARDGEILDISVVDDRIATVHFRYTDRFYDALTLVKVNGEWVIAAKVFISQKSEG
ncbi:MAG: nuclear transport factor 2 family protein [Litorimonas sp.]